MSIVRAVRQYYVDTSHAQEQRNDRQGGSFVLPEQPLATDEATSNTQEDDCGAEERNPPTHEERRFILPGIMCCWRRGIERHIRVWCILATLVNLRRGDERGSEVASLKSQAGEGHDLIHVWNTCH